MTDQNLTTQSPDQEAPPQPASSATPTEAAKTGSGKTYTEEEHNRILEQTLKERLQREQKKADAAADKARAEAEAEAARKNGEWQKLAEQREKELAEINKKIEEREAEIKRRDILELKRKIAKAVGLPDELATRLVGETEAEIEADAKALFETLPKPAQAAKPQPGIRPVNPGANGSSEETDAQKLARIHGGLANPFNAAEARKRGGGVLAPGS